MNKYGTRVGKRYKTVTFDTKDMSYNPDGRTISGYAAIFGNIDKAGDLLVKGCFVKSISERGPESNANDKIAFLWMHDMSEPIARITALREDDKGLYFEAILDDVELGDRALKQLESGTLNQFSIGFRYVFDKCEWEEKGDEMYFVVGEVILYEISVVTIGANGETEYLGLKSEQEFDDEYKKLDDELCAVLSHIGQSKQQKIQRIFAKAMTLASIKPCEKKNKSLTGTLNDGQAGRHEKKSMFKSLIN